ncbi:photosystem II Psb27 protein Psb27 [Cyanobacterium sp. HL-69]|nr:photosystem II Psb27 protein Psb27 [Cyanobacterium sp. HL-69]
MGLMLVKSDSVNNKTILDNFMIIKSYFSKLLALILVVVVGLVGCGSTTGLTGNYTQDTMTVLEKVQVAIALPTEISIEEKKEIQNETRAQINDYISRYRKNSNYGGLKSFTTMQTALNSLAGYYTSYGNRPIPDKLQKRLTQEFKQVEFALNKGY